MPYQYILALNHHYVSLPFLLPPVPKRLQSNANEPANKHNKTETTDLDDTTMNAVIDAEEENEGKKEKKATKTGGKSKNSYLSFLLLFSI